MDNNGTLERKIEKEGKNGFGKENRYLEL